MLASLLARLVLASNALLSSVPKFEVIALSPVEVT